MHSSPKYLQNSINGTLYCESLWKVLTMILRSKYNTKTPWVNKSCKWCFRGGNSSIEKFKWHFV